MKAKVLVSLGASLLVLAGCSEPGKKSPAQSAGNETSVSSSSTSTSSSASPTTSSSASSSSSNTAAATPNAAKEAFCRDVNTAVNISQTPGATLTATQTTDMTAALQKASTEAPSDVPLDFASVITAMLADLQAPTDKLPDSWNPNAAKLAQFAAGYCG